MKTLIMILALLIFAVSASAFDKQNLLDSLTTHFGVVDEPQLLREVSPDHNIGHYQVAVLEIEADSSAVTKFIKFYVKDEGLATEAAYFADRPLVEVIVEEPPPVVEPEHPTVTLLKEYIAPYFGEIQELNIENAWAICRVLLDNGTAYEEVRVLVTPDGQGGFNHKRIQ